MGKAEELVDDLMRRSLTPEEEAAKHPRVPELRLRADAPAVDINKTTHIRDVLSRLQDKDVGGVALRDPSTGPVAVVVPVERYLDLVGKELANDPSNKVGTLDGHIAPAETAIAASYVEQVNPSDTW
jgi:hypothetical protein